MTSEEWLDHELEALDRYELMALLYDFAEASDPRGTEILADFVDNWPKHS